MNLAELPQEVSVVVTLASLDAPEGVGFAAVDGLSLSLATTDEQEVTRFGVPALGPETAVVVGEVYRREGGWRFRAVGQGYDTGLAGVASDYGITVDDAGGEDAVPERPPAPVVDEPVVDEPVDMTKAGPAGMSGEDVALPVAPAVAARAPGARSPG